MSKTDKNKVERIAELVAVPREVRDRRGEPVAVDASHAFDTLYHAMAMQHGGTFVTADERYFAKARALGGIELLSTFKFIET